MADYVPGFGNHVATEAVPGALPIGQNSPQKVPFGLYAEQLSGTAFTAPRAENKRSWLYRIRPAANHGAFHRYVGNERVTAGSFADPCTPNRLRWNALELPSGKVDFVDSLVTIAGNGDPGAGVGIGIHLFATTASMERRVLFSADGELLIVPYLGRMRIETELGVIEIEPEQIAVVPRGVRFRVILPDGHASGYVCENYGALLRLPDLGPIGSNGLANDRDFETPVAWYEDIDEKFELIQKFQGHFWSTELDHSPLDVVAWHGNLAPYRYDLRRFNAINTVSYDHPDPSIFTVLTSPSDRAGTANVDFVIFPPRWLVAEHTFRPPWFHRNVMGEFMGLINGVYDAKLGGFAPGGISLHNTMNGHGPDQATYEKAIAADLAPHKYENTMAFMFESRSVIRPTAWALEAPSCQHDYDHVWSGFEKAVLPK
ncbi:homogentisate 1,2-dioxygenase [Sphingobium sp. AP50]|uniref:homogentisate 1,2-dioxygenase n=1 Tax=Sphingobium sp. AP50 TaxID=1884369 RepID=UPI0008B1FA57|nr:homogentisate 1,2-dioxygenase [Sphingobium sp. AP50]SEJ90386.1 homogentisate 1,2-dioxygenase [Sphingobium sp. AP50]